MKISPEWNSLTSEEAEKLKSEGKANISKVNGSKTVKQIWLSNIFTFYNMLNVVLAVLIFTTGSYRNAFFLLIVALNFFIGVFQELKAKRTLDKLSVLTAPTARVIRDGKEKVLPCEELCVGDVIIVGAGDQLTADGTVLSGEIRLNESLITGESDAVMRKKGERLLSGSFVISGECAVKLTAVGSESYAEKITVEAKRLSPAKSVLKNILTKIIKVVSAFIIPIGIFTFINHYFDQKLGYADSMISTVASMVGMIPDGLYLLTSMSFFVGVFRLAQKRTVTRQLYSLESLARADIICLDKTGTITTGKMSVKGTVPLADENIGGIISDIYRFVPADNATAKALIKAFGGYGSPDRSAVHFLPFSSENKYVAADFKTSAYILGAPEFVLGKAFPNELSAAEKYTADGTRVLALCSAERVENLYKADKVLGFILLEDEIRPNVAETFGYFYKNGVSVKVISGDSPSAVSAIAKKAGVKDAEKYVDASLLTDEELSSIAENTTVFGRVNPKQKQVIINALQKEGHTVAMTGDGVNDVLALKDADCSVAMAGGASAATHVSQFVLLDSDFSVLPSVVLEGRRVINNIERASSLFLMKTVYSFMLAASLLFLPFSYPFVPIHLTLIGLIVSGIPGFFLAFEPNFAPIPKNFVSTVLKRAAGGALTVFTGILLALIFGEKLSLTPDEISTICVIYTGISGLITLLCSCLPLSGYRAAICLGSALIFGFAVLLMPDFFMLVALGKAAALLLCLMLPLCFIQLFIRRKELWKKKN